MPPGRPLPRTKLDPQRGGAALMGKAVGQVHVAGEDVGVEVERLAGAGQVLEVAAHLGFVHGAIDAAGTAVPPLALALVVLRRGHGRRVVLLSERSTASTGRRERRRHLARIPGVGFLRPARWRCTSGGAPPAVLPVLCSGARQVFGKLLGL